MTVQVRPRAPHITRVMEYCCYCDGYYDDTTRQRFYDPHRHKWYHRLKRMTWEVAEYVAECQKRKGRGE